MMLGSAESEDPKLTVKLFSKYSNACDHKSQYLNVTDGWTDRQTNRRLAVAILLSA